MSGKEIFLYFPQPQRTATFLRRPQRFLAEMGFSDGTKELVYCANPGAMAGSLALGSKALLWESSDPKRKRRYTWRAVEHEGLWIGTDTHLSNRIVEEALRRKLIPGFEGYSTLTREYFVESGFRVDFMFSGSQGDCLLEVKSATVVEYGAARYPDSLTPRGVKHLKALTRLALMGNRVVLVVLVQRGDAHSFVISNSYDSAYAEAFDKAIEAGVELLALEVSVFPEGFGAPRLLPYATELVAAMNTNQGLHS
ncbi:MAG: DNA/RNA nuclease SfsA [Acidimicrobiaceae bacterium]|nr:DNA/RNA nuclease SfsA [Acidimicrobiaceae bacterium]